MLIFNRSHINFWYWTISIVKESSFLTIRYKFVPLQLDKECVICWNCCCLSASAINLSKLTSLTKTFGKLRKFLFRMFYLHVLARRGSLRMDIKVCSFLVHIFNIIFHWIIFICSVRLILKRLKLIDIFCKWISNAMTYLLSLCAK